MATDLSEIGLIDKRRMREFDALCHLDVEEMPPEKIKSLREKAHVSQAVFAAVLNTNAGKESWSVPDYARLRRLPIKLTPPRRRQ
jgi:putative transcriptional regulator